MFIMPHVYVFYSGVNSQGRFFLVIRLVHNSCFAWLAQNLLAKHFAQLTATAASTILCPCEQKERHQRRTSDNMANRFSCHRKSVIGLFNSARKPLGFVTLCLVLLMGNIGMIHRFACVKDETKLQGLADVDLQVRRSTEHRRHNDPPVSHNGGLDPPVSHNGELDVNIENQVPAKVEVPFKTADLANQVRKILPTVIPPNIDRNQSMSACLLIKDDNDILNEWLAYHYHAIKLRYLVVAIDPSSEESPKDILARWRNKTDLSVLLWSDADFMPEGFLQKGYHKAPHEINGDAKRSQWHEGHEDPEQVIADNMNILNHRYRQLTFLSKCLGHLKKLKRKWALHVDTDEYVVVNPLLRNSTQNNIRGLYIRDIREPSSVFDLIQDIVSSSDLKQKMKYPCISMPRLLFGSIEDKAEARSNQHFNATLLETRRWLRHTSFDDKERNAQPKVILDVSAVSGQDEMFRKPFSIHRPSRRLCRGVGELTFTQFQRYPITVNHYVGSWERYNSKNDSRRSRRAYERKAFVQDGYDNWITPWLDGFIETHGLKLSRELLADYVL
jgi:hypothetical protein